MMNTYFVTVMQHTKSTIAPIVANVLRVEVDRPISWVRQHVDEIAARAPIIPALGAPCALWVSEQNPANDPA